MVKVSLDVRGVLLGYRGGGGGGWGWCDVVTTYSAVDNTLVPRVVVDVYCYTA